MEKLMSKALRLAFRDVAITFRMPTGFAGDVNRNHPASISPELANGTLPPLIYGQALVLAADNISMRPLAAGDTALTQVWGLLVRPYPIQAPTAGNYGAVGIGAATPPNNGAIAVLRDGYILAAVNGQPVKGGQVHVWCAASAGAHIQGGFEAAASGGNTADLDVNKYIYNSAPGSDGITEILIRL